MISRFSFLSLAKRMVKYVVLTFAITLGLYSQPTLQFDRISVSWPDISLFISTKCGIDLRLNLDTTNFKIKENSVDIPNFTISCPDPNVHYCISAALVIDKSGSMGSGSPTGLDGAKAGAKAFVGAMDGNCDEATLVSFNDSPGVDVFMTNDKVLLDNGINSLQANGATAVWDAIIMGINEVINNGSQKCRAVIVLTDGEDNASHNSVDGVISLALQNKIRVFTIGLGSGINDGDLTRIASDTGGKYYKVTLASQLAPVFLEIYQILIHNFYECEIKYSSTCMDGARRNVELTLQKLFGCAGTDLKTKSYVTPKDTSTFQPVNIRLQTTTVQSDSIAYVPLILETPLSNVFNAGTFKILFDNSCCHFDSIITNSFLFDGVPITVVPISGGLQFSLSKAVTINGQGVLAMLKFKAANAPSNSFCTLNLSGWTFQAGCLKPVLFPGEIIISSPLSLSTPNGGEILCKGDTSAIRWLSNSIQAFDLEYSNDNGKTFYPIAQNITGNSYPWFISDSMQNGPYIVRVSEHGGIHFDLSKSFFFIHKPPVVTVQPTDTSVCKGLWTTFFSGVNGFPVPSVQWQQSNDNGVTWNDVPGAIFQSLPIDSVQQSDDRKKFRAIYSNTCGTATTNAATLHIKPDPSILLQPSDQIACRDGTAKFSVQADSLSQSTIQWQISTNYGLNFSDIPGATYTDLIINNVDLYQNGDQYRAVVSNRCSSIASASAGLTVKQQSASITTHPLSQTICEGDSVTLSVIAQNASGYQWQKNGINLPAETLSVYKITKAIASHSGSYSVIVYGDCGWIASNAALINVGIAPAIVMQPTSQTADENKSATFIVHASGSNLTFQWLKDGVPIPGKTDSILTLIFIKKSDEGNYSVEVKGSCGVPIISNGARLNVVISTVEDASIPTEPVLYQNYPNPFSQETAIGYRVAAATNVRLELFDLLGRKITTLIDEEQEAGMHYYNFNPDAHDLKLKNGVFMVVMHVGTYTSMKQIVLMK